MLGLTKKFVGYKLNACAFSALRDSGIPEETVNILLPIENKHFIRKTAFLDALQSHLPKKLFDQYLQTILNTAQASERAKRLLHSYWINIIPKARFPLSMYQYLMVTPVILALRFRIRWAYYYITAKLTNRNPLRSIDNTNVGGFEHNFKQVLCFTSHRYRTEGLMNILRTIMMVNPMETKLLCVGPRNEGEILLFPAYGFPLKNIAAIDLFSYSPLIKTMDMNALTYADNSFDVYYSSAVIVYSPNITLSISESIRVTKPGGLIAINFGSNGDPRLVPDGSRLETLADLLALYKDHIDYIFWQEEYPCPKQKILRASVIFRLKK
ncbi:MAG: class I SAM-dependent methyltransferase [Gammaproteobacteria bacterium]|nr:class I SAM-dependent methyltransferase [Gammaproteobacteria bacterium]